MWFEGFRKRFEVKREPRRLSPRERDVKYSWDSLEFELGFLDRGGLTPEERTRHERLIFQRLEILRLNIDRRTTGVPALIDVYMQDGRRMWYGTSSGRLTPYVDIPFHLQSQAAEIRAQLEKHYLTLSTLSARPMEIRQIALGMLAPFDARTREAIRRPPDLRS